MNAKKQTLTKLAADDDPDDRFFIRKAWEKMRCLCLRFLGDGLIGIVRLPPKHTEAGVNQKKL